VQRPVLDLIVVSVLAAVPITSTAQKLERRAVKAQITFSVDEYDPAAPAKGVMRCAVRNDSPYPVHVPVGFDGGYVKVRSGGLSLQKTAKEKDDVRLAWLEPDEQVVVFELPLEEILLGAGKTESAWQWTWDRQPAPPRSPIQKYKQAGFVDQAAFAATIDLGSYLLTTEPGVLRVKED
jgi:hypothetical protein